MKRLMLEIVVVAAFALVAFVTGLEVGHRKGYDTAKGRNACVIDCSEVPHQFWFWDEASGSPVWTKKEKGTVSW